jgi:sirohydrochlorin ferrochelatase
MKQAILIVDHGSTRPEANAMLEHMARLVQFQAGDGVIVRFAHMELAEPSIARGFADCVEAGATEVVAFPYMLSPGKHSTRDIPRLIAEAAAAYPSVPYRVTAAFGVHEKLGELILMRAGLPLTHCLAGETADRCWDPAQSGVEGTPSCGDACRLRGASTLAAVGH